MLIFILFFHYKSMASISCHSKQVLSNWDKNNSIRPPPPPHTYRCYMWNMVDFRGENVWSCWRWWMDDDGCLSLLQAPLWAFGSGELKNCLMYQQMLVNLPLSKDYLQWKPLLVWPSCFHVIVIIMKKITKSVIAKWSYKTNYGYNQLDGCNLWTSCVNMSISSCICSRLSIDCRILTSVIKQSQTQYAFHTCSYTGTNIKCTSHWATTLIHAWFLIIKGLMSLRNKARHRGWM